MADNTVTLVGNVTRDPELRFTNSGMAICAFGLAVNRRWPSRSTPGEWEEKVSFFDVVAWGQFGENVAESVGKGNRVIVCGRLDQQTWEDKDTGKNRSKIEVVAESIGPDLKWATTVVTRNERSGGGGFADREPDFDPGPSASRGGGRGRAAAQPSYDEEPF